MLMSSEAYRHLQIPHEDQLVDLIIRPIRPEDAPALQLHHLRLSNDSVFYRFHGFKKELTDEEARRLCDLDGHTQAAVVAVKAGSDQPDEIEGVARYYLTEPGVAEMAIVVRDAYQGHGLGKSLLEELINIARANDIHYLDALVLSENWHMRHLLHELDRPLTTKSSGAVVTVRIQLDDPDPTTAN